MKRWRLERWVVRRATGAPWWQEGAVLTPPYVLRRDPAAALLWAVLHPEWLRHWLAPYLALPGDRFHSFQRMADVEILRARRGMAVCRYETREMAYRGLPAVLCEVDLRDGWERVP